jgi:hypothetical protein
VQDNSNLTLTHKPEPNPGGVLLIRFAANQVPSYGNVVNAFLTNRGESAISGAGSKLEPQKAEFAFEYGAPRGGLCCLTSGRGFIL